MAESPVQRKLTAILSMDVACYSRLMGEDEVVELFQIWVEPRTPGREPGWATRAFPGAVRAGQLVPLASGQEGARGEPLPIDQDATLYGATLARGQSLRHELGSARRAYIVPSRGRLTINGVAAGARDGVAARGVSELVIAAAVVSELLLFDLP